MTEDKVYELFAENWQPNKDLREVTQKTFYHVGLDILTEAVPSSGVNNAMAEENKEVLEGSIEAMTKLGYFMQVRSGKFYFDELCAESLGFLYAAWEYSIRFIASYMTLARSEKVIPDDSTDRMLLGVADQIHQRSEMVRSELVGGSVKFSPEEFQEMKKAFRAVLKIILGNVAYHKFSEKLDRAAQILARCQLDAQSAENAKIKTTDKKPALN